MFIAYSSDHCINVVYFGSRAARTGTQTESAFKKVHDILGIANPISLQPNDVSNLTPRYVYLHNLQISHFSFMCFVSSATLLAS
jgi:hypothetical protein